MKIGNLLFFENTVLASADTLRCAAHDTPRSFEWCERNCPKYYSCDTIAQANDEVMLLNGEAEQCEDCGTIVSNEDGECGKCDKQEFEVTITEKLQMKVYIMATSKARAEEIAEANWKNDEYLFYDEHFQGATFEVSPAEKHI